MAMMKISASFPPWDGHPCYNVHIVQGYQMRTSVDFSEIHVGRFTQGRPSHGGDEEVFIIANLWGNLPF